MENNKFDLLIPELTRYIITCYFEKLISYSEFKHDVDTSPLLNMTMSVFINSFINILYHIKKQTIGEDILIKNIELAEEAINKLFGDLPFITKVEQINY